MPRFIPCLFLLMLCVSVSYAQRNYDLHWVGFKDKKETPHHIWQPQTFLSPRAIERRWSQNIRIDSTDLPVSPAYIAAIQELGYKVFHVSKWMNGVLVVGKKDDIQKLAEQPFVREVRSVGFARKPQNPIKLLPRSDDGPDYRKKDNFYGNGENQAEMLNVHYLHKMGYRGAGMRVAIMDGGFSDIREMPVFDSLFAQKRLLGTRDFVEGDEFVLESSDHGRDVLSDMASYLPYLFVGTSPDASYYLFKTEDEEGEYVSEEYYWLMAAEYADSLGVDVINSSLGYNDFDDNEMDYGYVDLDGNTTIIAQAADFAAKKGILVVTSAGNSGDEKWKHLNSPADADSVLTVGSVDRAGFYSNFSSLGFKGRYNIKPNVMARGTQAVVASVGKYDTRYNSGTSFSSPIMAGVATSTWQALHQFNNMQIIRGIEQYASKAQSPDNQMGYGIPDVYQTYKNYSKSVIEFTPKQTIWYHPQVLNNRLDIFILDNTVLSATIELRNALDELIFQQELPIVRNDLNYIALPDWANYPAGTYLLYVKLGKETKRACLVKY